MGRGVHTGAFEDWPEEGGVVDLAVSAEAFHWLDQTNAYRKIVRALQPGGTIALFWNRHVQSNKSEGFFEAAHEIYRREAPELVKEHPLKLPARTKSRAGRTGLDETGWFSVVTVRNYRWDAEYDSADYIHLLSTYSGQINLDGDT